MANENKALAFLTDTDFNDFCEVAVLDAASTAIEGSPTSSGEATFALLATSDAKYLKAYRQSLAKILVGQAAVQAAADAGSPASAIAWALYQGAASIMLAEVWGPDAERNPKQIPGTP